MEQLTRRRAKIEDLTKLVALLREDMLGQTRETNEVNLHDNYIKAFNEINTDPNHYLMVVEYHHEVIATCHLTLIPSLTHMGSKRMQIEAVRVAQQHRAKQVGTWMLTQALLYAKINEVVIVQLTTDKSRVDSQRFYEKMGFTDSHEGMKLYLE